MTIYERLRQYQAFDFEGFWAGVANRAVERVLREGCCTPADYLTLLSPTAAAFLEQMARQAQQLTQQYFGRTMLLYTPLYVANYCVNQCRYCGFAAKNAIRRQQLSLAEVEAEAKAIAATGLQHILLLSGEAPQRTTVRYLCDCIRILRRYFSSVGIEVYPLTEEEYRAVIQSGADGITVYQEVYQETIYAEVHPAGPKRAYRFRLEAAERACRAGIRTVNIGALLGLGEWRREAFCSGLHAYWLQKAYPEVEFSMSPPRLRPPAGSYQPHSSVSDREWLQYLLAFRLFMPHAGITVSTRETAALRDAIIGLGVTKMSAASCTAVGGHAVAAADEQFAIADTRDVPAMMKMLREKNYQPLLKDW